MKEDEGLKNLQQRLNRLKSEKKLKQDDITILKENRVLNNQNKSVSTVELIQFLEYYSNQMSQLTADIEDLER